MSSSARQIGLFPATMLVAGNMIGAGIFMMPTVMASIGGIASLGWLVTAPGAFIMGYMFARLGRVSPKAGGPYAYAREALGDFAGFQCNLLYWFSNVVANIAIATSMTGYIAVFFPALRVPLIGACATVVVVWLSAFLNMIGPRLVTRFETVTTLLGIGPIALVGIGGWLFFDPEIFRTGWNPAGLGEFHAISAAVSIMFWSFMGVESASVAAAVVKDPEKNIGRATLLGVLIAALVYVLSTTAIMGIIPNDALRHSTAPFADAAMRALGPVGGTFITLCAIVKASGCLGGWTLINAETALATAKDGLFPAMFARTDSRGVPVLGLVIVSIIMSAIVFATVSPSIGETFMVLADIAVLLVLTPYIFAAVSIAHYVQAKVVTRSFIWVGLITIAYCLAVIVASAGTAVAVSMALGLATAPLFRVFLAFGGNNGNGPAKPVVIDQDQARSAL
ncbi:arginine:agmatine antiporter [Hypericibacter adhaerens]|jgi:arginine:agmatine antiporter|uniref:Arginine/agmatine antiporter n=1 Tax=Hypericibacter adhaerens TaxID=2602016 RepID=A0A5J6MTZ5_9PROT|nr:amino acid permease [Hypericibacter adhaerens]QEX20819.1 arginine:agmatine antiporter [Hypericibacter adhaerens]